MRQGLKLEKSQARGTAGCCSQSCGLCVRDRQTDRDTETTGRNREEGRGRGRERQRAWR